MPKLPAASLSRVPLLPLAGVLLLALALRVWGLTWGLPSATHYFSYHPDESVVLEAASSPTMNVFAGRLLPHFYNYGSLQLYLVCFANTLAALSGAIDIVPKNYAVWHPQWAKMYLVGRCLTVGMGVGTVFAVYRVGERLWGRRAGLLAALTLAVMPLHTQHSHFLTVDVPATFWAMLSLLWAVRLATGDPKPWRAALWAGVFAGLAAATKYNLALAFLPLVAACVVTRQPKALTLGLPAFVLAFLLACPGAILEHAAFLRDLRFEASHVQNGDDPTFRNTGSGFVYHVARNLDAGLGLPLLLLALVSVGYALYKHERGDGLLAAFALPYYVLISLAAVRYARYTIPLLPVLALWVGRIGVDGSRLSRLALRRAAAVGGAAVLAWTLFAALWLIEPMAATDPRDRAYAWIQAHAPRAAVGFPTMPWFGTVPLSPYFSYYAPGVWRKTLTPGEAARIVYRGKDWDTSKRPPLIAVSEYASADALRRQDPAAAQYFGMLRADYALAASFDRTGLNGLRQDLPHDMTYPSPALYLYQRRP